MHRKYIRQVLFATKEFRRTCCRSRFRYRGWTISISFSVRQHKEAMTMPAKKKINSKENSQQPTSDAPTSDAPTSDAIEPKPKSSPKTNDANQMLVKLNLRQLRLPTMNAEFDKLAREAAESNETYQDYLLRLTELEVAARSSNALNSRIKQASFPVQKDLDTYDFSALPSVNKQKVLELSRCEWISGRRNVCLLGQPGTGKTHLAVSFGLAACRHGLRTKFFTAATLVNQLEEAQQQFALDRMLKRLDKLDLLIVDELGYLSFSRSGAELLFQVFADRYERRSLTVRT
jgi:DNA replication protein DnaC